MLCTVTAKNKSPGSGRHSGQLKKGEFKAAGEIKEGKSLPGNIP